MVDTRFISTFVLGALAHKSDIPLWKLPREITHYIDVQCAFCKSEKLWGFFCDGLSKTRHQRSDQRAVYGQR